jgi:hypothetical protein
MENDKYIVFKAGDAVYNATTGKYEIEAIKEGGESAVLHDAVVIRPQDIFAGPGLSAYAASIQTAIDLIKAEIRQQKEHAPKQVIVEEDEAGIEHLEELRDFFWMQAYEALNREDKKIPD